LGQKSTLSQQVYQDAIRHQLDDVPERQLQKKIYKLEADSAEKDIEIAKSKQLLDQSESK
jgi:hypothetical protein